MGRCLHNVKAATSTTMSYLCQETGRALQVCSCCCTSPTAGTHLRHGCAEHHQLPFANIGRNAGTFDHYSSTPGSSAMAAVTVSAKEEVSCLQQRQRMMPCFGRSAQPDVTVPLPQEGAVAHSRCKRHDGISPAWSSCESTVSEATNFTWQFTPAGVEPNECSCAGTPIRRARPPQRGATLPVLQRRPPASVLDRVEGEQRISAAGICAASRVHAYAPYFAYLYLSGGIAVVPVSRWQA